MAGVAVDVNDVGVAGSFVFAGREYAECASLVVSHDTECAPLAVSLLLWSCKERGLIL